MTSEYKSARKAALIVHNESIVLFQMRAGQVWRCWRYDPSLPWGELPDDYYFTLLAPRERSIVPGEYTLMRSRLQFGDVKTLQMTGVSFRFADLRMPAALLYHTNWTGKLLTDRKQPLIFEPKPFSWAPWSTDVIDP